VAASEAVPIGAVQSGDQTQFTANENSSVTAVEVNVSTIDNTPPLRTATISMYDQIKKSAKSEFHFQNAGVVNAFKNEKLIRGGFSLFLTTIPGVAALEWAIENIDAFKKIQEKLAMPNKNEPIRIVAGTLPKQCVEALIIYCKFKGFNCTPPYNFRKTISDDKVAVFAKYWAVRNAGKKKFQTPGLEQVIEKPSP
jgi:hypothetical protein